MKGLKRCALLDVFGLLGYIMYNVKCREDEKIEKNRIQILLGLGSVCCGTVAE
jgi:hypothetical protein